MRVLGRLAGVTSCAAASSFLESEACARYSTVAGELVRVVPPEQWVGGGVTRPPGRVNFARGMPNGPPAGGHHRRRINLLRVRPKACYAVGARHARAQGGVNVRADSAYSRTLASAGGRADRAASVDPPHAAHAVGLLVRPWSAVARHREVHLPGLPGSARRRRGLVHPALP